MSDVRSNGPKGNTSLLAYRFLHGSYLYANHFQGVGINVSPYVQTLPTDVTDNKTNNYTILLYS